jgi:hypothetical protein
MIPQVSLPFRKTARTTKRGLCPGRTKASEGSAKRPQVVTVVTLQVIEFTALSLLSLLSLPIYIVHKIYIVFSLMLFLRSKGGDGVTAPTVASGPTKTGTPNIYPNYKKGVSS